MKPPSAGTHSGGGALDVHDLGMRLSAAVAPLTGQHVHLDMDTQAMRMAEDRRWVQKVAAVEKLEAKRWLHKHVNSVRTELGLPTVEQEQMKRFNKGVKEMSKALNLFGQAMLDQMQTITDALNKRGKNGDT